MRLTAFVCLVPVACGGRSGTDVPTTPVHDAAPEAAPTSPPYEEVYLSAQLNNCSAFTCHTGRDATQGSPDFGGAGAWASLVDDPSTGSACAGQGWAIVIPGSLEKSLLWRKVSGTPTPCGAPMNLTDPTTDLPIIEAWILAGAPHG